MSLWNLQRDGLTNTALATWVRNPHEFYLKYMEGWEDPRFKSALEWGNCFHYLIETDDGSKPPDIHAKDKTQNFSRRWQTRTRRYTTPEDRQKAQQTWGEVRTMYPLYLDYWKKEDKGIRWIERESEFSVEHVLPDLIINLRGKIDGVFRHTKKKNLCILETKTKGRIDDEGLLLALPSDFQTLLYAWAASKIHGKPVSRIRYNIIRRPQLHRRKADGKEERLSNFLSRLKDDVSKRPEWYFLRYWIELQPDDLAHFEQHQLNPRLRRFHQWHEAMKNCGSYPFDNPYHENNSNAFFTESIGSGRRCDLFEALTTGNFAGLVKRKRAHPELEK